MPSNLEIVGTVNLDESTHCFSRKVLDRAFTIELSEIELNAEIDSADKQTSEGNSKGISQDQRIEAWPRAHWDCSASRLAEFNMADHEERNKEIVETLIQINQSLQVSQLQVGYRTRDEVSLFVLNADQIKDSFVTTAG